MDKTMDRIYEKLYEITDDNMRRAGKELLIKKEAFIFKQISSEDVFDVSLCGECDNAAFLQIAYLGMLGRMPDPGAVSKWMKNMQQEPEQFRRLLIEKIALSEEFSKRNVKIMNNIYSSTSVSSNKIQWYDHVIRKTRQRLYYVVQKGYGRFPEKGKKLIKKVLRR